MDQPQTKPLEVWRQSLLHCLPNPCQGEDPMLTDRTALFDVYAPGSDRREVWIARVLDANGQPQSIEGGYYYKVIPHLLLDPITHNLMTELRSGETLLLREEAKEVSGYPYELRLLCVDIDGTGIVDSADPVAWVNQPVDVDFDGQTDMVDLTHVLEAVDGQP